MIPHSKPTLDGIDFNTINNCVKGGLISRNHLTYDFEQQLSSYLGVAYTKVTNSGTSALVLGLKALGINNASQEVLLPTYVCKSVADAIAFCGGTPIYYDNDLNWISSFKQIKEKITDRTQAIIVVHIMGMPVTDIEQIVALKIPVIEDVCQAFGASINGVKLGNFGKIGIYSFHATKCLTTGEGGAITTNDEQLGKKILELYQSIESLYAFTDLQATLGTSQLNRYDSFLQRRKYIAEQYFELLPQWCTLDFKKSAENGAYFRFLLKVKGDHVDIKKSFEDKGIQIRKGVDDLLHRKSGLGDELFPNATSIFNQTISLPIYPSLSSKDLSYVIAVTNNILKFYES